MTALRSQRLAMWRRRALPLAVIACVAGPSAAQARVARLDLTELTLEELLNVEVTLVSRHPQRLSRTAAAATVLSADDIRRSGARTLPEALRLIPGVQVAHVDANKWVVTSRGFAGLFANKLLVLIDGRSVYTPMFSGVFWESQDVLLADVERIEVIRGPGGTLWGANAVNGIINVVTYPSSQTQGGHVTVGAGTEERAFTSARFGGRFGENGYYRVYGKGYARDQSAPAGLLAVGDDWRRGTAGARLDMIMGDGDEVSLQMEATAGSIGQGVTFVHSPQPPFVGTRYYDVEIDAAHLQASWSHRLRYGRELAVKGYYERFDRREEPIEGLVQTLDADLQYSVSWAGGHRLVWGAGYRRVFDEYDGSFTLRLMPEKRTAHLWSAFAHAEVVPVAERLHLSGGTKLEDNSYTGFEWQPNVRLWYAPVADHGVWLAASRAVRTPSRADHGIHAVFRVVADSVLMVLQGDRSFSSESVVALEMGYRGQLAGSLAVDAATYHNRYYDLQTNELGPADLSRTPPELPLLVGNLARARSHGLELGVDWQAMANWWVRGSYTYLNLDIDLEKASVDFTTEGYEGESPSHQLGLRAMGDLPHDVELDVVARLVGRIDNHDIERYMTADLRLSMPVAEDARLVLVGQNLLQNEHREMASNTSGAVHTAVQRGAYAALEWMF